MRRCSCVTLSLCLVGRERHNTEKIYRPIAARKLEMWASWFSLERYSLRSIAFFALAKMTVKSNQRIENHFVEKKAEDHIDCRKITLSPRWQCQQRSDELFP